MIKDYLEEANRNHPLVHNDCDSIAHDDAAETQKQFEIDWPLKKIGPNDYSLKDINYAFIDSLDIGINAVRCKNAKLNKSMEVNLIESSFFLIVTNSFDHANSTS